MNRNVESHFSQLPRVDIQRSIFDRSSSHKTSLNAGDLVPLYIDEVLPGDTFRMTTSKVIRLQTMLTPIMDNVYLDVYWFFVPNRLTWEHWQQFCGENTESAWAPTTQYTVPKMKSPENGFAVGTLADYFGIPVNVPFTSGERLPSALPFRAYALICDTFFRDQNLSDPLNIPLGDANQQGTNGSDYISDVANGGKPFRVAKYHDYFTSCLPSPQKGVSPTISTDALFIGGNYPVYSRNEFVPMSLYAESGNVPTDFYSQMRFYGSQFSNDASGHLVNSPIDVDRISPYNIPYPRWRINGGNDFGALGLNGSTNTDATVTDADNIKANGSVPTAFYPANLWTTIPEQQIPGATINIGDIRIAFAIQRYLEQLARSGSRYIELLSGVFGVTSPDARLHLPEYLGGNRIPIQIHQVTNTAQAEQDFLGDLGAMSLTHDVHQDFEKSFTEHGYLICVGAIRYDHTYAQGLERFWSRNSFTDFYMPVFANIGEQPVYKSEIYFDPDNQDDVFGYQEAWADYRYKPSRVSGEMRPGILNTLASWHLADYYEQPPTLSDAWIREDKTNLDRALAVSSEVSNQAFLDIYFQCICTRPMPMYSIPAIEAHF